MADNPGPVVSNTTPLINLVGVGMLNLLPNLYGQVFQGWYLSPGRAEDNSQGRKPLERISKAL